MVSEVQNIGRNQNVKSKIAPEVQNIGKNKTKSGKRNCTRGAKYR